MKEVSIVITTKDAQGRARVYLQRVPQNDVFYGIPVPEHGRWRPTLIESVTLPLMIEETTNYEGLCRIANKVVNAALMDMEPVSHPVQQFSVSDDLFVLGVHLPFRFLKKFRIPMSGGFASYTLEQLRREFVPVTELMRHDFAWNERNGMIECEMAAVFSALGDALKEPASIACSEAPDSLSFPEDVPPPAAPISPDRLLKGGVLPAHVRRQTVTK